jgi:SAM-dependent methyltransferase
MRYKNLSALARDILIQDSVAVDDYLARLADDVSGLDDDEDEDYVASVSLARYCKNIGISNLLAEFDGRPGEVVLDVMGGAGQVASAARTYGLYPYPEWILTGDRDLRHIVQADRAQLPAVPLDVTDLSVLAPQSVDHVLLAHHVHHLSGAERVVAVAEIVRCLRRGGTLVIYEGPADTSTANISDTVVDELSGKPHTYRHPGRDELIALAGHPLLDRVEAVSTESPLVFLADDEQQARDLATAYYIRHYSLRLDTTWAWLAERISEAYRRAGRGEALHVGPVPDGLLDRLFPVPDDRRAHAERACVIVSREGLIVKARRI